MGYNIEEKINHMEKAVDAAKETAKYLNWAKSDAELEQEAHRLVQTINTELDGLYAQKMRQDRKREK